MRPDQYLARVRELCATLPDCGEKQSWGHPNFTVGGCIFAAVGDYAGRATLGIATSKEEQALLVEDERFAIAPYVGRFGWVIAWLDRTPDWALLEELLRSAHARMANARGGRAAARPRRAKAKAKPKPKAKAKAKGARTARVTKAAAAPKPKPRVRGKKPPARRRKTPASAAGTASRTTRRPPRRGSARARTSRTA